MCLFYILVYNDKVSTYSVIVFKLNVIMTNSYIVFLKLPFHSQLHFLVINFLKKYVLKQ